MRDRQYEAGAQPQPIGRNIRNRPKSPVDTIRPCDKCGRTVAAQVDAGTVGAIKDGEEQDYHRHLFPVIEDGVQVCEGSPSLCQYLPDQQRDPRGVYEYDPGLEQLVREAYQQLQTRLKTSVS